MNKEQACKLSSFIVENALGFNLKIFSCFQDSWEIDNENSDCDFHIGIIDYNSGEVEIAVSMKHLYNKFKDCPIIVKFPDSEEEWKELENAMIKLRNDCFPDYAHESGYLLNRRLEE